MSSDLDLSHVSLSKKPKSGGKQPFICRPNRLTSDIIMQDISIFFTSCEAERGAKLLNWRRISYRRSKIMPYLMSESKLRHFWWDPRVVIDKSNDTGV